MKYGPGTLDPYQMYALQETERQKDFQEQRFAFFQNYSFLFDMAKGNKGIHYSLNLDKYFEYTRSLSPNKLSEFNQNWFASLSLSERIDVFKRTSKNPKDGLFQKFKELNEDRYEYQIKGLFSFCYPNSIFDVETYMLWTQYCHQNDKTRWFEFFPLKDQITLFHKFPGNTLEGLYQKLLKSDVNEREEVFKSIFSFCYEGQDGEFQPEEFEYWLNNKAHPIEKFRWVDELSKSDRKALDEYRLEQQKTKMAEMLRPQPLYPNYVPYVQQQQQPLPYYMPLPQFQNHMGAQFQGMVPYALDLPEAFEGLDISENAAGSTSTSEYSNRRYK